MKLSAHQPAYLPWIGFFNKVATSDRFVIMDDVQFEKNSFINRNQIITNQGNQIWLTIPVQTKGYKDKKIKDIEIDNTTNWKKKHWDTIIQSYKKTPYFEKYRNQVEEIYIKNWKYLVDVLNLQLRVFLDILEIETPITLLSDLAIESKKQDLIKDMCVTTECNSFLFGANGINYADDSYFQTNNIEPYYQNIPQSVSRLSILHALATEDISNIKAQVNEHFSFSCSSR